MLDFLPVYAITVEMLERGPVITGIAHDAVPFLECPDPRTMVSVSLKGRKISSLTQLIGGQIFRELCRPQDVGSGWV